MVLFVHLSSVIFLEQKAIQLTIVNQEMSPDLLQVELDGSIQSTCACMVFSAKLEIHFSVIHFTLKT